MSTPTLRLRTSRRLMLVACALLTRLSVPAWGEDSCRFKIEFDFDTTAGAARHDVALKQLAIVTENCGDQLTEGTRFTFSSGAFVVGGKLPAPDTFDKLTLAKVQSVDLDRGTFSPNDVVPFPTKGKLTIGSADHDDVPVEGKYFTGHRSRDAHSFSLGPAMSANADGAADAASAIRVQYRYEYAAALGTDASVDTAVSIDTTNRSSPDYIDDNSVSLRFRGGDYRAGSIFARVRFFGEAVYARAVHSHASNADASAGLEFRMPFARSVSLFRRGTGEFIAPPLSVTMSYGYRWHDTPDVSSDDGGVFKGSALYHLYIFGKFRVDLQYDYTYTDFSDPSSTEPRTQRMYRGTIAYLVDNHFQVKTSYEDGSIGPVLTKIKQYFIGIAFTDGI
jgi:hypothetical protein